METYLDKEWKQYKKDLKDTVDETYRRVSACEAMLHEIQALLKVILNTQTNDMKQFGINVAADLFVEMLNNNKELKDKILNTFKL